MTTPELDQHHFALVDLIGQAYDWTRRFPVWTDYTGTEGETLRLYPLRAHSEVLAALHTQLGGIPAQARATGVTFMEGQALVRGLQPSSPHYTTHQDMWRYAVDRACEHATTRASTEEIAAYRRGAQALFNDAFNTVRTAYADCAAATFGRHWARWAPPANTNALLTWVKALADVGFSAEECEAVLHLVEDMDPESVAKCRAHHEVWSLT